ncbi:MAG TPA: FG-GAP-like repeat-containing protein [Thermoanaerobaculia bacterium]|nr:FG-GAP-like repeat-containing protein [Thermoanaerobaculia bacterium]
MLRSLVSLSLVLLSTAASAQDACRRGYEVARQLVTSNVGAGYAAGDFNHDGRVDFVAFSNDRLLVLLNRGGQVFEVSWQGTTSQPIGGQLYAADVTGDGHLDAIMWETWMVAVAPGIGDGTFAPFVETRNLPPNSARLLIDLDGDRLPELVHFDHAESSVVIHAPQRDGSFRFVSSQRIAAEWFWDFSPPQAGDFDGDGRIDLMSVNTRDLPYLRTHVLWNDGDGTFSSALRDLEQVRIPGAYVGPVQLDGDTATELVAMQGGLLYIFEANGRQLTYRTENVNGPGLGTPQWPVGTTDLDRDGALDVVWGGGPAMTVLWGPREGEDSYARATFDFSAGTLTDMNGDGLADIVSTSRQDGLDVIHGAAGSRALQTAPVVPHFGTPWNLFEADIDRDGKMDLAIDYADGYTTLLSPEGSTFTEKARIAGHRVQAVADIDGDGHLDLVTRPGQWEAATDVHFGTGDFAFSAPLQVSRSSLFEGVAARSAGGNALIFTTLQGVVESVFVTNRSAATTPLTTVASTDSVAVADVDGDGDSDIVIGDGRTNRLLAQEGAGWTSRAVEFPLDQRFNDVVTGDLDRDGRVDLLLVESDGYYRPLLAKGDGTYVPVESAAVAANPLGSLRLHDVDRDGLLDVVVTARSDAGHFVIVHRNTGSAFVPHGLDRIASVSGGAAVLEDFDHDGWDDLIVAHAGGVALLRSVCTPPRVRAAFTPARPLEGQPVTLTVNTEPSHANAVGQVVVRRNGAVIHVEQPDLAYQFGSFAFTLPPLPAGTHAFEVEYRDQYAGTTSTTVTVTVDARGKRRRAVRSR